MTLNVDLNSANECPVYECTQTQTSDAIADSTQRKQGQAGLQHRLPTSA